ncbi:M16 family metallopeptidase [Brevundimonas sp.]|jgi:zinc protease|uniref:M16 family metallopeptidase n=1 Tax=Brevundimonas sp. TaxID=1871086 RepID=UPI0037C106D6
MNTRIFVIATALGLLGAAAPATAQAPAQTQPAGLSIAPLEYRIRTLPNGLQVLTLPDRNTADVTVQVWYRVGSKDDPQNRSGFAHLFEHMMFKATRNLPGDTWESLLDDVGGVNNAGVFPDSTWYFSVAPANQLERLLFAEAERMGSLVVDESSLISETSVVQEEYRQRVLAEPYGRLFSLYLPRELYRSHPYRRPAIGSLEDLSASTVEDVRRFHATYYRPDNAVLVVAGDFDGAQLDGWIDRYFGPLDRPGTAPPIHAVNEPAPVGPRQATYYAPNVPAPAVVVGWRTVPYAHPDRAALKVLNGVLSTGQSSRLFQRLVYDQRLAPRVASSADFYLQGGTLTAHAMMAEGHDLAEGESAMLAEVARLRDEPVSDGELQEAKTELVASLLRDQETIDRKAHDLGQALLMTGQASAADAEAAAIQAVTVQDVQRVARQYLTEETRIVVRYLNEAERPDGAPAESTPFPVDAPIKLADLARQYEVFELAPQASRAALPQAGPERAISTPEVFERTLANGLRVYVAPTKGLPLVSARLSFAAGSADDPAGRSGLAGLTASLLTQGAAGKSAPQIASEIERLGAVIGATPGADFTSLHASSPSHTFEQTFALLTDLVRRPDLSAEDLDRQKQQAIATAGMEHSQPMMLAYAAVARAVYGDAPYGAPGRGTPSGLAAISAEDVTIFRAQRWRPEAATLVFSGDVDPEAAFMQAEAAFGDWAAPSSPSRSLRPAGPPVAPRVIVIDMPGAGQAGVYLGARAVRRTDEDYYPLLVANSVLGGGFSGRLNRIIRVQRGLAYYALSGFLPREDEGIAMAFTQTRNEKVPQVVEVMLAEIGRLSAEEASPEEMATRRAVLVGGFARGLETVDGLGSAVATLANHRLPVADLQDHASRIRDVSAEAVKQASAAHLDLTNFSIVVVGDASEFIDALRAAHAEIEVIPAAVLDLDRGALH